MPATITPLQKPKQASRNLTQEIEVATDKLAHGSSPEEMHLQYPHLSLAQIYAALAYYYEHQTDFEAEILRQAERAKAWAEAAKDFPIRQRLKEQVSLPQAMETI